MLKQAKPPISRSLPGTASQACFWLLMWRHCQTCDLLTRMLTDMRLLSVLRTAWTGLAGSSVVLTWLRVRMEAGATIAHLPDLKTSLYMLAYG